MSDLTALTERLKLFRTALSNLTDPVDRAESIYKMACFVHGDGGELPAVELFEECRAAYRDLEAGLDNEPALRRSRIARGAFGSHYAAATAAYTRRDFPAARAAAIDAVRLGERCVADNRAAAETKAELLDVGLGSQLGAVQMFLATLPA